MLLNLAILREMESRPNQYRSTLASEGSQGGQGLAILPFKVVVAHLRTRAKAMTSSSMGSERSAK